MTVDLRTCSVVDEDCQRPPGYGAGFGHADASPDDMEGPPVTCYSCGDDVCLGCSKVQPWRVFLARGVYSVRLCRVCNRCRDEEREFAARPRKVVAA